MTRCPNCGEPQGHRHIGWKNPGNCFEKDKPQIGARQIECEKCHKNFVIVEYNDAGADEVHEMINTFMFGKDKKFWPGGGCATASCC